MRHTLIHALIATALAVPIAPALAQSDEALVIFSNGPLTVIGADGRQRTILQGESLKDGDRLITPPGTLGQLKLPDGSLVSARPESDVRLGRIGPGADRTVLELGQGSVRVINVAPPAGAAPRPVDIVTPVSTMQLTQGDGETFHVRPGSAPQPGQAEAGTYNRLQAGAAVVRTQRGDLALQGQQIGFAPRADAAPTEVAALPAEVARQAPPVRGDQPQRGDQPRRGDQASGGDQPQRDGPPQRAPDQAGGVPAEAARRTPSGPAPGQDTGLTLSGTTSLLTDRSLVGAGPEQSGGRGPGLAPAAPGGGGGPGAGAGPGGQGPGQGGVAGAGAGPGAGPGMGSGNGQAGAPGAGSGATAGMPAGQMPGQMGTGSLAGQRPTITPMPGGIAQPRPQPPAPPPPQVTRPGTGTPGSNTVPGPRPPGGVQPPR